MAYRLRAPDLMGEPNIIPMADIMLVLLIIFMVVTPMIQPYTSVDRPAVANPRDMATAEKEDALVVAVTRDGTTFLGSQKLEANQIANALKDKLVNRVDKTVFLNSDKAARYGKVVAVVDEIRAAGVDQLGLLTEKSPKESAALPPPSGGR